MRRLSKRSARLSLEVSKLIAARAECLDRDRVAAWLQVEHDMQLVSWGLNADGHMEELFQAPGGMWAVVLTRPNRCAAFLSLPVAHFERLEERSYGLGSLLLQRGQRM